MFKQSPFRAVHARSSAAASLAVLTLTLGLGLAGDGMYRAAHAETAQPRGLVQALQMPSFADVVDQVKPAVVSVRATTRAALAAQADGEFELPKGHPLEKFLAPRGERGSDRRGERQRPERGESGMSQGSGFFISADGFAVTNNHVIQGATEVQLVTDDGKTIVAKVIGTDPRTDVALLKADVTGNVPFVALSKGTPRIGDWVLAVGNPFGLGGTVTAGIVSARGRDIGAGPYDDFIQIDAPVNSGNSGGPTFDLSGRVVGVNTAIASPSGGNVGIAFAIPAATVEQVVAQLKSGGQVSRGFLGVQVQPVTSEVADAIGLKEARGALVSSAEANGPAARAGIKRGDTILAVDGTDVKDARDLTRKVGAMAPGAKAAVKLWRDGAERSVTLELGRQPKA